MTKEEKMAVVNVCKGYRPALRSLRRDTKDVATLERKATEAKSALERDILLEVAKIKQAQIATAQETISQFEEGFAKLNGLDACVMRQLYIEGKLQTEVEGENGKPITERRVRVIRDRAAKAMYPVIMPVAPMTVAV